MYPIRFLTNYLLLLVFFYFGAAEPPPTHGYGPPSPVEFNSNEVASHEYTAPVDFGNYGSFSSGSSSGYRAPQTNYAKAGPSFATPHFSSGRGDFPVYKSGSGGGKGGVSSSYISIVHGPGGAASPSKQRPVAYVGPTKSQASAAPYKSQNFPSASFGDGPSGFTSAELNTYFGKGFGAAPSSQYNEGAYDFPSRSGHKQQHHQQQQQPQQQGGEYESNASDELGSYSRGEPSYATFSGSKPQPSFNPSTFSSHSGSRGGNAYSTSNILFNGGKVGGGHGGHGSFHAPSLVGSFKPSGTKAYNRYSSPSGSYQVAGGSSSGSFGGSPLAGSETSYNSRALKAGYTAEQGHKNADELSGEDAANYFGGFGDGAGFKVQSSYSTG